MSQIGNLRTVLFLVGFMVIISVSTLEPVYATTVPNPNLFVSAQNNPYDTNDYFSGPRVIEVTVKNPDIQNTNQIVTEPSVLINGKQLRMAQGVDGYWYAFFADSKQAQLADSTQPKGSGKGLDFGMFCSSVSAIAATGVDFSNTKGIAIPSSASGATDGSSSPTAIISSTCSGPVDGSIKSISGSSVLNHVVRKAPYLNQMNGVSGGKNGQIGINQNAWPVIQLYDFSTIPTNIVIDYQKNTGDQIVNLTFDRTPSGTYSMNSYTDTSTQPTQDFLNIVDNQLSIDPTDVNSWTWTTNPSSNALYYEAFDSNGNPDADGTIGMQNLLGKPNTSNSMGNLTGFLFNNNEGKLTVSGGNFQTNGLQKLNSLGGTNSIPASSGPMTLLESSTKKGSFANYDANFKTDLIGTFTLTTYDDMSRTWTQSLIGSVFPSPPRYPIANSVSVTTNEYNSTKITLSATSFDGNPLTYSIVSNPAHGTISSINSANCLTSSSPSGETVSTQSSCTVIYTPNFDYAGTDSFTYKAQTQFLSSNATTISITVNGISLTPSAIVGPNQIVNAGTTVTLNGSSSIDPRYNESLKYITSNSVPLPLSNYLKYSWTQTAGVPVILSSSSVANPTFVAPSTTNGIILTFTLTVTDQGTSTSSPVTITVKPSSISQTVQNTTITTQVQNQTNHSLQNNASQQIIPQQTSNIPSWVKGNAKYWHDGTLGDDEFEKGIKYMIDNKIIKTDKKTQTNSGLKSIPKWIKSDAGWWADGTISQDDFLKGIEYLVEKGIINVK